MNSLLSIPQVEARYVDRLSYKGGETGNFCMFAHKVDMLEFVI